MPTVNTIPLRVKLDLSPQIRLPIGLVDVNFLARSLQLSLLVLLETKIKLGAMYNVKNFMLPNGWVHVSNGKTCNSTQIWILWDLRISNVSIIARDVQCIHCQIFMKNYNYHLTRCYGDNNCKINFYIGWKWIGQLDLSRRGQSFFFFSMRISW